MALVHSPRVVTDGLVFYYDMQNTKKSWQGAPTTNLHPLDGYYTWPAQTLHFWNGNNWVVDSTYTHPGVDGPLGIYLGKVRKYTSGALSASWSGNSYAYVLKTAPMTAGQSYAMSAYTFLSSNCNIDGMNSSIEGASVSALAGGYVTGYDTLRKGTWQRQGLQGTGSGNVNFIIAYPYRVGVTDGSFTGFILVGGAQVEFGTFPTPYTDTTRSNTQAVLDLTGQSTITAQNLTYNSNGTFSWSVDVDARLQCPASSSFAFGTGDFTIDCWINPTNFNGYTHMVALPDQYTFGLKANTGDGAIYFYSSEFNNYPTTGWTLTTGTWNHVTLVRNASVAYAYLNGTLKGSKTGFNNNFLQQVLNIGNGWNGEYTSKSISNVKIYNRALSANEVAQNFAAQRGLYGL